MIEAKKSLRSITDLRDLRDKNQGKKLQMYDSGYFHGNSDFEDDGM